MRLARAWIVLCCAVVLLMAVIAFLSPDRWLRAAAVAIAAVYGAAFAQWRNELAAWNSAKKAALETKGG